MSEHLHRTTSSPAEGPTAGLSIGDACQALQVPSNAMPDAVLAAYQRLEAEVSGRLALNLPAVIQESLQRQRERLQHARDLLLDGAARSEDAPKKIGNLARNHEPASQGKKNDGEARHDFIGEVLSNRYEVVEFIGEGGMGRVFRAFDRIKQAFVAVKIISPEIIKQKGAQERFVTEAKLACSLSHPNIIRVHDVSKDDDCYYITMELLHGQTLRARMEQQKQTRRPFQLEQGLAMGRDLLSALAFAHQQIVHRDIKPENIWVCDDGTVKLMDFGVAQSLWADKRTRSMQSVGSAYYVAPEQVRGLELDHRADQYSLAAVLYELFSGRVPTGVMKPLHEVRKDVPVRVSNAIMKALHPMPEDRFPTTEKFSDQLSDKAGIGLPGGGTQRMQYLAGVGVALLVLVLGVGLWNSNALQDLHLFDGDQQHEAAVKSQAMVGQMLTRVDAVAGERKAALNAAQAKLARLREQSHSGRQPVQASDVDTLVAEIASTQIQVDLWTSVLYPAALQMEIHGKRAVAEENFKASHYPEAGEKFREVQAQLERRIAAADRLKELADAKSSAEAASTSWRQYAGFSGTSGASEGTTQVEQRMQAATTALAKSSAADAIAAYRDAERGFSGLHKAAREKVAHETRVQVDAEQSARRAEQQARDAVAEEAAARRAELVRIGRQFRDRLSSGGQGPSMVVVRSSGSPVAQSSGPIASADFRQYLRDTGRRSEIEKLNELYRDGEGAPDPDAVTMEDARNYANWLRQKTDLGYRLGPTKKVSDTAYRFWIERDLL